MHYLHTSEKHFLSATFTNDTIRMKGKVKKGKGKSSPYSRSWRPRGGVEVQQYALTSALDGGGWSASRPGRFAPGKETRHPLYSTGNWAGPRAGLDGCGKSRPHQTSIPGPSRPSQPTSIRLKLAVTLLTCFQQLTSHLRYLCVPFVDS